uniref:Alpha-carbonic anhydrase domain-containing protein n=1 Tax=viral metagenome TaxID=1070528 RepID=A0A6C0EQ50_9ZZZZ
MSTNNTSINISTQNSRGVCDLKCAYNFNYPESNLIAKNMGVMINLTYDNANTSPVLYNNQKYKVTTIIIVSPSIHIFNNSNAAAEIIIEHTAEMGGQNLLVGIPIVLSSESSDASNFINEIIASVSNNAPAQGESTNLNISGFSLQKIVPKKPFFSYTDNTSDWIVYGILSAIPLNSSSLNSLTKIIKPFPLPTPGSELFYNPKGPNATGTVGDGIYISCQPTGSSEEETDVTYAKNTTSATISFNNPIFFILLLIVAGCIIFVVLFFVLNYVYNYLTNGKPKLSIKTT